MLKVGLIGCGFMGSMHANCYNNLKDVKVTAVADVRREKAEELSKISGAEIYACGKDLIEKADVDVIDICLPTFLHAEHALLAMEKTGFSKDETAIIGDRLYTDIACGVNAGISSIFVLSGEGTMNDVEKSEIKPEYICENIRMLLNKLTF